MADVLSPEQRSLNMSRIRGRDTRPELLLRRGLHAAGLRFRLHRRGLPGRPDLVFPRHQAVILVHGCFWHGHHCPMFRLPATRTEFWAAKIGGNRARDQRNLEDLTAAGWRVLTVWECCLKGPARRPFVDVISCCAAFVRGSQHRAELAGTWPDPAPVDHREPLNLNAGDEAAEALHIEASRAPAIHG
ncbi:very short patch repair endonuclease [Xanthobacter sp. V3C-3]|uniref:very short patch repair endonuclease n=1 Tax=Xanthobacter lutulentifluminis TaxID=3119935 RepID=UPI00372CE3DC